MKKVGEQPQLFCLYSDMFLLIEIILNAEDAAKMGV